MANFSVPIYTIEDSGFQLPISLGYQHNGLVVDQIPGHLGMGWSLSAGGMLTRQMRGRPDEDAAGYIGAQMTGKNTVIPYINNQLSPQERVWANQIASENLIDLQPDKFIANVGNMSVTFYFDENRNPVIKPYKPYEIATVNNDFSFSQGFKITDDQGVQYFFQDIETTKRTQPIPIGEIPGSMSNGYTSGWKVSKIVLTNNKEITFNYEGTAHHQSTKSQSYSRWISGDSNCAAASRSTSTRNYTISSKLIKNIVFPKGTLEFENTIVTLPDNNAGKNKYLSHLDKISLSNKNNQIINTFDLNFDDLNKTRKLLKKVKINNDTKNLYSFDYYGSTPEDILFSKQDFWGYYNSNTTNYLLYSYNINNLFAGRAPDFNKTLLGALKKITYPTKGTTELQYESNTFNPEGTDDLPFACQAADLPDLKYKTLSLNWLEQNNPYNPNNPNTPTSQKADNFEFTVTAAYPYADIDLRLEKKSDGPNNDVYGKVEIDLINISGRTYSCGDIDCAGENPPGDKLGCEGLLLSFGSPIHNNPGTKQYRRRVKLQPGTYRATLRVINQLGNADTGDILLATANVNYHKSQIPTKSLITGGLRISKMKNCPSNNPLDCIEKEFIYESDSNESYGKLFRKRNITSYTMTSTIENGSGPYGSPGYCTSFRKVYSSSSNVPLGYYMGSHVFYDKVIEKTKSSNGSYLGRSEKTFVCAPVAQNLTFPFLDVDNKEFKNGKPLSEKVFNAISPNPISEKEYTYNFYGNNNINKRVYALSIGVDNTNQGTPVGFSSNSTIFENKNDRDWLTKVKTKEVLNNSIVQIITDNIYTNPQGHLRTSITDNSENEILNTVYSYPYTNSNSTNNLLVSKNRLAMPVEVTSNKLGITAPLSRQVTQYKNWGGNIITPEYIKSSKNNSVLEDRVRYYKYDIANGNPLEVSKANGTHIVYIWGYNKEYPIAKVENATYSQVQTYVANLQAKSNADIDRTIGNAGFEGKLRVALNSLRAALPDAQVSTYTYDPLIGVTSMTDPRGYTVYYDYDDFNRLKQVKDAEGNILNQNDYNYAPQN